MTMNAVNTITPEQYKSDSLKLSEALKNDDGYEGVITAQKLDNGAYAVLSWYSDMVWTLNPNKFPQSVPENKQKIDFTLVPSCFVAAAKRDVANNISQRLAGGTVVTNAVSLRPFFGYLASIHITSTSAITPLVAMQYVDHCKALKVGRGHKNTGKPLSKSVLSSRLAAVERLQKP